MVLVCKDFKYGNFELRKSGFVSVNFDDDTTLPEVYEREAVRSEQTPYRDIRILHAVKYASTLNFEIHIIKNDLTDTHELTHVDYGSVLANLLSITQDTPCEITTESGKRVYACGVFTKIEPFDVNGVCYGVRLTFENNSPFVYQTMKQHINTKTANHVFNVSNSHFDTVYPCWKLTAHKNTEIYLHNQLNSTILKTGLITQANDTIECITELKKQIQSYANVNSLRIEYVMDDTTKDIKLMCDRTCLSFYTYDIHGIKTKCYAYIQNTQYTICHGGFFYCSLKKSLPVFIDTRNLSITDEIGRAITLREMGMSDYDETYWLQLIPGDNAFRVYGDFEVDIEMNLPTTANLIP